MKLCDGEANGSVNKKSNEEARGRKPCTSRKYWLKHCLTCVMRPIEKHRFSAGSKSFDVESPDVALAKSLLE